MDNQTTFIPHENTQKTAGSGSKILLITSLVIFAAALIVFVGAYFLRQSELAKLSSYQESLDRSTERFSEGLSIHAIEEFDTRLRASKDLLARHKSFTGLFMLIERITLKNVQFISFSYNEIDNNKKNVVRLVGRAPDYKTIAEESEQFSIDEDARRYITNVVFSNLSVDTKDTGLISFEVTFTVDPEFLSYSRYLNLSLPALTNEKSSPRDAAPVIRNQ